MNKSTKSACFIVAIGIVALFAFAAFGQALDADAVAKAADKVVTAAGQTAAPAPGCAIGVALDGRSVYEKAYGMADLEYSIPNTAQTIFESGSVAKQFTAASIVLLALDGKLKLDDPVKTYIPELPDYGAPLTIRHLLNHTGGVRDWGPVLALTGSGRGDRVVSQALARDIIVHQRNLDFLPGSEYSYSNSGYTLLATIVERVSKQSLPVFTAERLFKPLGMTHSSWRDDYQRIVPGRAQAYSPQGAGAWRLEMPFMNVYGNGGMLTTVGDWLKWNAMLDSRSLGAPLVDQMETTGVLNDNRKISYALGLIVGSYKGKKEVSHNGSTAGYQTYLGRFPELKLSIAVLCNAASANPTALARRIVDEVGGPFEAAQPPDFVTLSEDEIKAHAGVWRNERTHLPLRTTFENGALKVNNIVFRPLKDGSFLAGGTRVRFEPGTAGNPGLAILSGGDNIERYLADQVWTPTPDELKALTGVWHSDEADSTYTLTVEDTRAWLTQRPATKIGLNPVYKDHFTAINGSVVWFTRTGKTITMHVGTSRMRDMPFTRLSL